ncbi:hypothetical protein NMY22_g9346 [Coprinellus aureogranulatus]|nr:hypothetical protein NMY22_g9346 [Coprinellus aureogranulatus]
MHIHVHTHDSCAVIKIVSPCCQFSFLLLPPSACSATACNRNLALCAFCASEPVPTWITSIRSIVYPDTRDTYAPGYAGEDWQRRELLVAQTLLLRPTGEEDAPPLGVDRRMSVPSGVRVPLSLLASRLSADELQAHLSPLLHPRWESDEEALMADRETSTFARIPDSYEDAHALGACLKTLRPTSLAPPAGELKSSHSVTQFVATMHSILILVKTSRTDAQERLGRHTCLNVAPMRTTLLIIHLLQTQTSTYRCSPPLTAGADKIQILREFRDNMRSACIEEHGNGREQKAPYRYASGPVLNGKLNRVNLSLPTLKVYQHLPPSKAELKEIFASVYAGAALTPWSG